MYDRDWTFFSEIAKSKRLQSVSTLSALYVSRLNLIIWKYVLGEYSFHCNVVQGQYPWTSQYIISMFCPLQWLQAFTIMDQNRDGFIDKNDLRDTFAALGKTTSPALSLACFSWVDWFLLQSLRKKSWLEVHIFEVIFWINLLNLLVLTFCCYHTAVWGSFDTSN